MEIMFENEALRELYEYGRTNDRKYAKYVRDPKFVNKLRQQIDSVRAAASYQDLKSISPLHYEKLKHSHSGLTSFRVGNKYVERVICRECEDYIELTLIELDNTHYGNKK